MGEAVYRNYDAEALYAQYNNRAMIAPEELEAIKADQVRRSDAFRAAASRAELDIAYGPHARERLDLFLPEAKNAPLFAFIHGGYWQWNDKQPFVFLCEQLVAGGAAFANIEYALCPDVSLSELTRHVEDRLDHGPLGAGSHRVTGSTFPQQKREGPDDDRLPRPGLPGKSAQPGPQLEGQIMDDCIVPNAEFDEHGRGSTGGVCRPVELPL